MTIPEFVLPDWSAPATVRAVVTTRIGGVSHGPYDSFNLATHVGDDPQAVHANRAALHATLHLPSDPVWLRQVHGIKVVDAAHCSAEPEADGAIARVPGKVCVVLTADCLPVFLCDRRATRVAVLHAGWRGLANGILEAGVQALDCPGRDLMAWLGPAIGPQAFEVGEEVRHAFMAHDLQAGQAFLAHGAGKYLADLYLLARQRLSRLEVGEVTGGSFCTVTDAKRFYSYRRDGATGRMASLIWLA